MSQRAHALRRMIEVESAFVYAKATRATLPEEVEKTSPLMCMKTWTSHSTVGATMAAGPNDPGMKLYGQAARIR